VCVVVSPRRFLAWQRDAHCLSAWLVPQWDRREDGSGKQPWAGDRPARRIADARCCYGCTRWKLRWSDSSGASPTNAHRQKGTEETTVLTGLRAQSEREGRRRISVAQKTAFRRMAWSCVNYHGTIRYTHATHMLCGDNSFCLISLADLQASKSSEPKHLYLTEYSCSWCHTASQLS
jgi:hypothetical protein